MKKTKNKVNYLDFWPNNEEKQNKNTKKYLNAFTLVELIVVIVILAILATIAFLSFNSYSANSRDSVRLSDANSFSKSLELFNIKAGGYPIPDDSFNITYSGGIIWYQGKLGDSLLKRLGSLSKKIVDPLDNSEYIYSKLAYGNAYQIKFNYEGDSISLYRDNNIDEEENYYSYSYSFNYNYNYFNKYINNHINDYSSNYIKNYIDNYINNDYTNASAGKPDIAYIKGNYMGVALKSVTGSTICIIAVPSIVTNIIGTNGSDYNISALSGTLLYHGQSNKHGINYDPNKVVYCGASIPSDNDSSGLTNIASGIINAYSGSDLVNVSKVIKDIVNTPASNLSGLGGNIVSNQLGGNTSGGGNVGGQVQAQEITPASVCTAKGQTYTGSTTYSDNYGTCDTPDKIICSGSGVGQVWSMCNVGSTVAGLTSASYGNYYQWGRNKGFPASDTSQYPNQINSANPNLNDIYKFVANASLPNNDWLQTQSGTLWGGNSSDSATVDWQTNDTLRKGPCSSGRHVPSVKDWQDECDSIMSPTICSNGMADATGKVRNSLLLPYAGYRYRNNGLYYYQSTSGNYWSSSPSTTNAFSLAFNSTPVRPTYANARAYGFTIRCIKN